MTINIQNVVDNAMILSDLSRNSVPGRKDNIMAENIAVLL
jgi:hypothetical protein